MCDEAEIRSCWDSSCCSCNALSKGGVVEKLGESVDVVVELTNVILERLDVTGLRLLEVASRGWGVERPKRVCWACQGGLWRWRLHNGTIR